MRLYTQSLLSMFLMFFLVYIEVKQDTIINRPLKLKIMLKMKTLDIQFM